MTRIWLAIMVLVLGAAGAHAQGPTSTCVEIGGASDDAADLKRLVMSEIDRHATHRSATSDCTSYVRVERLSIDGTVLLTGRINTQVPHREPVVDGNIGKAVERMLRVLLNNDPVRLRGPRRKNWLLDGLRSLKKGRMVYGVEAFQLIAPVADGTQSVPGIAVYARREVDTWQLGLRLHYAGKLDGIGQDLTLVGHIAVQMHLAWFTHPLGDTSFYLGALAGVDHQRFQGPSGIDGGPSSASATLFGVGGRMGVEMFRTTSSRVDLFAQALAPTGTSTDDDDLVVDAWVPSVTIGAGIAF